MHQFSDIIKKIECTSTEKSNRFKLPRQNKPFINQGYNYKKTCLQNYPTDSLPKQKYPCYLFSSNLHVMSQCGRYPLVKNKLKRCNALGLCDRCAKPGHPTEQCKGAKEAFKAWKRTGHFQQVFAEVVSLLRHNFCKHLFELCSNRTGPSPSTSWSDNTQKQKECVGILLFGKYFWSHILCWFIFEKAKKVHDVKRRGEKNIQNKAVQTKLNLYIKKYLKMETLQIF